MKYICIEDFNYNSRVPNFNKGEIFEINENLSMLEAKSYERVGMLQDKRTVIIEHMLACSKTNNRYYDNYLNKLVPLAEYRDNRIEEILSDEREAEL